MPSGIGEYGVAKERKNDPDGGLNMRAEPSAGAPVVLVIPPNGTGLVLTDSDPASDYTLSPGAVPVVPALVDPTADHVFAMHHIASLDCQRTIITFGRDFSFDDDFDLALQPSDGVPPNIALSTDLAEVRVRLPEVIIAGASTASELLRRDNGAADVLFVRSDNSSTFGVRAFWDGNRGVRYFYLERPGRLVIETIEVEVPHRPRVCRRAPVRRLTPTGSAAGSPIPAARATR
jgi:hypothetical protein